MIQRGVTGGALELDVAQNSRLEGSQRQSCGSSFRDCFRLILTQGWCGEDGYVRSFVGNGPMVLGRAHGRSMSQFCDSDHPSHFSNQCDMYTISITSIRCQKWFMETSQTVTVSVTV